MQTWGVKDPETESKNTIKYGTGKQGYRNDSNSAVIKFQELLDVVPSPSSFSRKVEEELSLSLGLICGF